MEVVSSNCVSQNQDKWSSFANNNNSMLMVVAVMNISDNTKCNKHKSKQK